MDPKKVETDLKKEKTDQQTENYNFSENRKRTQKKEETDPKKEETIQQTKNFKLFLKTGNESKK